MTMSLLAMDVRLDSVAIDNVIDVLAHSDLHLNLEP